MSTKGWVLAVFLTLVVSLVIYAKTTEETNDYAYFRTYHTGRCVWYSKGAAFEGERVEDVLKNIGPTAPFMTALHEEDVPGVFDFFDFCGWEVVSHSATVARMDDDELITFTCILRRK